MGEKILVENHVFLVTHMITFVNFKKLTEIPSDEKNDFNYQLKFVVTEEELKADAARVEEEVKAWREEVRKADKRGDLKEMRKLGYRSLY